MSSFDIWFSGWQFGFEKNVQIKFKQRSNF